MRAPGTGTITKGGYIRFQKNDKYVLAHRQIWNENHGDVPDGMVIHHVDGNKQNNLVENLVLVDAKTHKRIHCGYEHKEGKWLKICRKCGDKKEIESGFYTNKRGHTLSWCRRCFVEYTTKRRKNIAMLLIVLLFLVGCGGNSTVIPTVIEQPVRYCPAPLRPTLADPRSMPVLLDDYLTVVEYALELEKTIECYEKTD